MTLTGEFIDSVLRDHLEYKQGESLAMEALKRARILSDDLGPSLSESTTVTNTIDGIMALIECHPESIEHIISALYIVVINQGILLGKAIAEVEILEGMK